MTLVLRRGNNYYCDTKILTGNGEFVTSIGIKIAALAQPVEVQHQKMKIRDVIYGYAFTGAHKQTEIFVASLHQHQNLEDSIMTVSLVDQFKMINQDNLFEVVLIGAKADYAIRMGGDSDIFKVYPRDGSGNFDWSMGGGSETYRGIVKNHPGMDPVRAMISTFTVGFGSGGYIERWTLVAAGKKMIFARSGIYERRTRKLFDLMAKGGSLFKPMMNQPLEPEYIPNEKTTFKRHPIKRLPKPTEELQRFIETAKVRKEVKADAPKDVEKKTTTQKAPRRVSNKPKRK